MSDKIKKQAALYIYRPNTEYTCNKCSHYISGQYPRCALFAPNTPIKPFGTCGLWVELKNNQVGPVINVITKEEAGYEENGVGFSCKRCEYFKVDKNDCEKVDKDSPGDTPKEIIGNACCNLWDKDDVRGNMTTEQLNKQFKGRFMNNLPPVRG